MLVREIMTKNVRCVSPDATIAHVAAEMKRLNVGAIPVCNADQRLLGIITDRDIAIECVAAGLNPQECKVRQFMTADPVTIREDTAIADAFRLMAREQVHRLPVVESGRLAGIISLGDLAVNCSDDSAVAELLRHVSVPVRSSVPYSQILHPEAPPPNA